MLRWWLLVVIFQPGPTLFPDLIWVHQISSLSPRVKRLEDEADLSVSSAPPPSPYVCTFTQAGYITSVETVTLQSTTILLQPLPKCVGSSALSVTNIQSTSQDIFSFSFNIAGFTGARHRSLSQTIWILSIVMICFIKIHFNNIPHIFPKYYVLFRYSSNNCHLSLACHASQTSHPHLSITLMILMMFLIMSFSMSPACFFLGPDMHLSAMFWDTLNPCSSHGVTYSLSYNIILKLKFIVHNVAHSCGFEHYNNKFTPPN